MIKKVLMGLVTAVCIMGCPPASVPNTELELITTVKITLADQATQEVITWEDKDGPGGAAPVLSPAQLIIGLGKTYTATVAFSNILASTEAGKSVTAEIEAEKNSHQLFFDPITDAGDAASGVAITKKDVDNNGLPVGLSFELKTDAASTMKKLRVRLAHYGTSPKTTALDPNADVDVDVTFIIVAQ